MRTHRALKGRVPWLLLLMAAIPAVQGSAVPTEDIEERVLRSHVGLLNELSDRRRLNTFFPNEQSALYGVPIGYVNTSRGNLTFVRRDLVTVGRIPIVLARVYDSSRRTGSDFGPGWHLSLAETITLRTNGTLSYVDDSASELKLEPSSIRDGTFRALGPSDITSAEAIDNGMRITLGSGWTKLFTRIDDQFRLTGVRDPHGNAVTLRYTT